jgi:hypothetical protein
MFAQKALAAWETLEARFAEQLSDVEIDHMFARFVLGLTSPIHGEDEPAIHLDICRKVLALKLTPERVDRALRAVPKPSASWVESAYETLEALGTKQGRELLEQQHSQRTRAGTEGETPSLRPVRAEVGRTV